MEKAIVGGFILAICFVSNAAGIYQEAPCTAISGTCKLSTDCAGGTQVTGKCPTQPSNVKCCVPSAASSCSGPCSPTAKTLACKILDLSKAGKIYLKPNHFDSRGNNPYDGAAALDNIKDTCAGKMAKRSNYGTAPGGCICLKPQVLQAMYDYAVPFYGTNSKPIQVNSIAGGDHSKGSWHYQGNTMDVKCDAPVNHCSALKNFCSSRKALELCYPAYLGKNCGGHDTWVHCSWKNLS